MTPYYTFKKLLSKKANREQDPAKMKTLGQYISADPRCREMETITKLYDIARKWAQEDEVVSLSALADSAALDLFISDCLSLYNTEHATITLTNGEKNVIAVFLAYSICDAINTEFSQRNIWYI